MTRVKFCGFTRADDVALAVSSGADALGFVFYEPSSRYVTIAEACELTKAVPAFVTRVGLFVNAEPERVVEAFQKARLNLIQYHGDESPEYCESIGLPYIKAFRVQPETEILSEMER